MACRLRIAAVAVTGPQRWGQDALRPLLTEQPGLVKEHSILVVVKPERFRVAPHDADFAPVGSVRWIAQNLEDDNAVGGAWQPRDGLVGDGGHLGLALVVHDREPRVRLDTRQPAL